MVSFHFVLSCSSDQKSILYAQIITKITAIVQASHIKKSIADFIISGISLACISPFLIASSVSDFVSLNSHKTHVSQVAPLQEGMFSYCF